MITFYIALVALSMNPPPRRYEYKPFRTVQEACEASDDGVSLPHGLIVEVNYRPEFPESYSTRTLKCVTSPAWKAVEDK